MKVEIESNFITVLNVIVDCLTNEATAISQFIKSGSTDYKSELFNNTRYIDITSEDSSIQRAGVKDGAGVYVFVVTKTVPINTNKGNFNDTKNAARVKKEILDKRENKMFEKGEVLYVGKEESGVLRRIKQHICSNEKSKTYSLKLNDDRRSHLYGNIKVCYFILNNVYKKHAKIITILVENLLHKHLKPVVGSGRTG